MKSISTDAPTAKPVTPIQVLEGSLPLESTKHILCSSYQNLQSLLSDPKKITLSNEEPAASRTFVKFFIT